MTRQTDLALTALAPAIWGSTYIVTTELLPPGHPLGMAMLRALPAGLLLILLLRQMPPRRWLGRIFLLGALNFTLFWGFLFLAAYRLPGGVAATLGAVQPLFVLFLSRALLGSATPPVAILAALAGIGGVGLLVLSPEAQLDPVGIAAGLGGAASMALGMVLSRRWTPPVSALTFTAWQLAAGGLLLLPLALWLEPPLPALDRGALIGLLWLGLAGAVLTYAIWFRGLARLGPASLSVLGFVSPLSAVLLGWAIAGQTLSPQQTIGAATVLGSVWLGQWALRPAPARPAPLRAA